jgi:hypothetical protein
MSNSKFSNNVYLEQILLVIQQIMMSQAHITILIYTMLLFEN